MVTADLIEQGFQVLTPVSAVSPYDLVANSGTEFYKIQVKYRTLETSGVVRVNIRRSIVRNGKQTAKPMTEEDVDVIAVYCPDTRTCHYVKRKDCADSLNLRFKPSANNMVKNVKFAEDYKKFPG